MKCEKCNSRDLTRTGPSMICNNCGHSWSFNKEGHDLFVYYNVNNGKFLAEDGESYVDLHNGAIKLTHEEAPCERPLFCITLFKGVMLSDSTVRVGLGSNEEVLHVRRVVSNIQARKRIYRALVK